MCMCMYMYSISKRLNMHACARACVSTCSENGILHVHGCRHTLTCILTCSIFSIAFVLPDPSTGVPDVFAGSFILTTYLRIHLFCSSKPLGLESRFCCECELAKQW